MDCASSGVPRCARPGCVNVVGVNRRGESNRFCSAGCGGAVELASRSPEERRAHGREGGRTSAVISRLNILDRYRHLDRDDAIVSAWKDALMLQTKRRYRVRQRVAARSQTGQERVP